jgi:hypothetical protein
MEKIIRQLETLRVKELAVRQEMIEIARKRRDLIVRLNNGGMGYPAIAAIYGISRQRVEQIIKREA